MKHLLFLLILLGFMTTTSYSDHHRVYEIQENSQEVTRLNKKYPKAQLENIYGKNKFSRSFKGKGCKNSDKIRDIKTYRGNHTLDVFLACRITSIGGYKDHLRSIADKKAIEYCNNKYSSKAHYRGVSNISGLDEVFWRLVGDGLSLGFLINKRTVAVSYVCSDIKTFNEFKNISDREICLQATSEKGEWNYSNNQYKKEALSRELSLNKCNKINQRGKYNPIRQLTDLKLCQQATTKEGSWESNNSVFSNYILEAKRRSLTLEDCNKITNRKEKVILQDLSDIADESLCKLATTSTGKFVNNNNINWKFKVEVDARKITLDECNNLSGFNFQYTNKSNEEICRRATTRDGKWEPYGGSFEAFRKEAEKRNYTIKYCNGITGRNDQSKKTIVQDINTDSDKRICTKSTTIDGLWEPYGGSLGKYREEADQRNFSLEYCNLITERGLYAPKEIVSDKTSSIQKESLTSIIIILISLISILGFIKYYKSIQDRSKLEISKSNNQKTEEKAKREAEGKAKREAEEKTKREAEEKTKREAEEKAKREAEEKTKREAEEKAKLDAKEKRQREKFDNKEKNQINPDEDNKNIKNKADIKDFLID